MSALLSLEGICKYFGYRKILKNINFSLESGEFVILVGNNGAGKSTLLRIISSLMKPTHGEIFFKGKNQSEIYMLWLQKMGYVSVETQLYGDLSSIENLRLYGTFYEIEDLNLKINEILSNIDLIHVSKLPVRQFSSGMKKRLMIGRLMLYKPEILLLDEPFLGLDQISLNWFKNYLHEFNQNGGTVLMVTHQFEHGLELANRVMVLKNQNIQRNLLTKDLSSIHLSSWLEE